MNMELLGEVGSIAHAGGIGVAIITLIILYKTNTANNGKLTAIIERNSESNENLCETIGAHTEVIRSLKETIERKL